MKCHMEKVGVGVEKYQKSVTYYLNDESQQIEIFFWFSTSGSWNSVSGQIRRILWTDEKSRRNSSGTKSDVDFGNQVSISPTSFNHFFHRGNVKLFPYRLFRFREFSSLFSIGTPVSNQYWTPDSNCPIFHNYICADPTGTQN